MRISLRRLAMVATATVIIMVVASPAWAAFQNQGNRILYVRAPSAAPVASLRGEAAPNDMFSIRNNGDDRRRVTDSAKVNEFGGSYSPNGAHIVYWGQTTDGYQVFRANADGTGRAALTDNPISSNPSWSRNGARIVYVKVTGSPASAEIGTSLADGPRGPAGTELMIMDADGTGKHSILNGTIYAPGWSPAEAEIAYSAPIKGGIGIFLISPEGGEPQFFCCKGAGTAIFADWSPDGRRLLLLYQPPVTGPASDPLLITIRRNGTDPVPVTDESYQFTLPRFSDDGERVIFTKDAGAGALDLYSIRSDGTGGKKHLTDTPGMDEWLNYLLT